MAYLYSFLPTILVYEADALREAGFEVLPTFKAPHVTVAFEDLEEGPVCIVHVQTLRGSVEENAHLLNPAKPS